MAYVCPERGYIKPYVMNVQQDQEKIILADVAVRK